MSFRLFTCLGLKKKVQIQLHLQLLRKLYVNNPVVMDRCERWTTKEAEHRRIDAFKLWCWRRLLRIPWIERGSNQSLQRKSVLNIHWKDRCWSWSSDTVATWSEELTHRKRHWCLKILKAGGEGFNLSYDCAQSCADLYKSHTLTEHVSSSLKWKACVREPVACLQALKLS